MHFHTHRADDILSILRLSREFGFEVVLQHATEAYLVADAVAKRGIATSHTIVDSPGGKPEAINLRFDTPARQLNRPASRLDFRSLKSADRRRDRPKKLSPTTSA